MKKGKNSTQVVITLFIFIGVILIIIGLFDIFSAIDYKSTDGFFTHIHFKDYIFTIIGIILVGMALLIKHAHKGESYDSGEQLKDKIFAWNIIIISSLLIILVLMSFNFDFIALLMGGLPAIIIISLFLFVGIVLLKKSEIDERFFDINSRNYSGEQRNLYDLFNTFGNKIGQTKKKVYKVRGIIRIVFGFLWFGAVLMSILLPLFFGNISETSANPSYSIDEGEMTGKIITLLIGIILIVMGFLDVAKSKNKNKNDDYNSFINFS